MVATALANAPRAATTPPACATVMAGAESRATATTACAPALASPAATIPTAAATATAATASHATATRGTARSGVGTARQRPPCVAPVSPMRTASLVQTPTAATRLLIATSASSTRIARQRRHRRPWRRHRRPWRRHPRRRQHRRALRVCAVGSGAFPSTRPGGARVRMGAR